MNAQRSLQDAIPNHPSAQPSSILNHAPSATLRPELSQRFRSPLVRALTSTLPYRTYSRPARSAPARPHAVSLADTSATQRRDNVGFDFPPSVSEEAALCPQRVI